MLVRYSDLIFCLLTCSKCDLGEVEKEMFQVVAGIENVFQLLDEPKIIFG